MCSPSCCSRRTRCVSSASRSSARTCTTTATSRSTTSSSRRRCARPSGCGRSRRSASTSAGRTRSTTSWCATRSTSARRSRRTVSRCCGRTACASTTSARSSARTAGWWARRPSRSVLSLDTELERWKDAGRRFDHLGFDVFYRTEGAGPRLLLIHGYPFSSFDWTRIWPALTERFEVIAPDMLGMGFSAKPARYEYSVHDHADMHEALLASLGVTECHVLAHDIGDSVAQELLARRRLSIKSITWLNGGLFYEAYAPRLIQRLLSTTPLGDLVARWSHLLLTEAVLDRTLDELFGPETKPDPRLREQFHQIMDFNDGRRVTHKVGRFVVDRYHHRNRWVRAMRETEVPMRLVNGPCDPNSGRHMAERYQELIPDPDVVMLGERIGHWPQIEDPGGVLRAFLEFADRVER